MKNQSFFSFNSDVDVHGSVTKKKLPSAKKKKKKSYAKLPAQLRGGKKKKPFVYINLEVCSEVRNSSYFQDPEILGYCFC